MEEFGGLESGEKTIAVLGDRWWPQTAKQGGDRISKQFLCNMWKKRNERPNVGGASLLEVGMNGAPSRKGCVVNAMLWYGQITNECALPPPPPFRPGSMVSLIYPRGNRFFRKTRAKKLFLDLPPGDVCNFAGGPPRG